jgi:hypothetical protein
MSNPPNVKLVRAWAVTIFGSVAIVYGMANADPASIMVGFSVLGAEPTARAASNAINGVR